MSECFVYIIVSDATAPNSPLLRKADHYWRMCKVGISANPWARLATLQTASHARLELMVVRSLPDRKHAEDAERETHAMLHANRLSGEWFFYDPCTVAFTLDSAIGCLAAQVWGWEPRELYDLFARNGLSEEAARDAVRSDYGAEALAL